MLNYEEVGGISCVLYILDFITRSYIAILLVSASCKDAPIKIAINKQIYGAQRGHWSIITGVYG